MKSAPDGGLLQRITDPLDLLQLPENELPFLAQEIRTKIIDTVSRNGGHLASPLGVVELTIAMLRVFNPKSDKIVWDVGHQAYAYKLLTGRNERFDTLRQFKGVSGFPKMSESPYDHFGVGHASTSISAALGMAAARELADKDNRVVAVIGDGAMTGGMVYEAMNHAGGLAKPMVVILNDNEMSISKNVGALSFFLSRKLSSRWVRRVRREVSDFLHSVPGVGDDVLELATRSKQSFKSFFTPGILFEALRFEYMGPVNGHDFAALQQALELAAASDKPILVHVITQKGKGYQPAESDPANYHGIGRFNPRTGDVEAPSSDAESLSFTQVFSSTMCELAASNPNVVGITAAMPDGTGLSEFGEKYPTRFFDVGICEQHAVTFAAGLATQGIKPVVALYSTFLQRAYDQAMHDVCLQNLPVIFAIDRAGLVGEDGPTHHGTFDIAYLRHLPNLSILAPRGRRTLKAALELAVDMDSPVAVRYPRGRCPRVLQPDVKGLVKPGKGEMLREADGELAVVAVGSSVYEAFTAIEELAAEGVNVALFDPVWLKPLPEADLLALAQKYSRILVVEEHALQGGFGSAVLEFFNDHDLLGKCRVLRHGLPDRFIEHGKQPVLRADLRLDAAGIKEVIRESLAK
ncbi:1-deoxy-D-xylulose-5-phosphate synthase [Desulfovibrio sp. OttesenSCG-928-C06]|nr:1-deoxy-D-xylulose-5-phosphate synthase [Desulfovibrio sp. OttesenSCG-928-C06]